MTNPNDQMEPIDGNEAAARVAYKLSEVIAIYPITPSSAMGELSDAWAAAGQRNLWGTVPQVVELQSEGGAAGAVHGSLTAGALTSTFTASQGLLLMLPNMFKIAGELTPAVFHIAARSVSCQALSIFGDHSDVMATRATGWGMLCSASVQEAMDFAAIAHASTLKTRVPFLHFFDGFRISHEVQKIKILSDDVLKGMIDMKDIEAQRALGLDPEHPALRGTAQNPDVFFQAREAVNPFYVKTPGVVQKAMDRFAELTGRQYKLFEYVGAPDAKRVIVLMGSGAGAVEEAVEKLNAKNKKVGLLKVRLYRPFSAELLLEALPASVRKIAVLDRTKEPGSFGEPLFVDIQAAFGEYIASGGKKFGAKVNIIGGRYGLSSKEFTPAMVKGVFDELAAKEPKPRFTIGINDDVTGTSLSYDPDWSTEDKETHRAVFFGLGSDGTVGANKNSIKIIADGTDLYAQAYFVYDSKKSGSTTVSHLRFGSKPIRSTYLIDQANFVACHQEIFLQKREMLDCAAPKATFLLNTAAKPKEVWDRLPKEVQETMIAKKLRFYIIDGYKVAKQAGLGGRINTVMQTCFFELAKIVPNPAEAIKEAIRKTYGKKSAELVEMNYKAVDTSLKHLKKVKVPKEVSATAVRPPTVSDAAPEFVKKVTAEIMAGRGDSLPVSALPADGTYPMGTSKWEKRNVTQEIPVWDTEWCIQCGKCAFVCPHACIRAKVFPGEALKDAPEGFKSLDYRGRDLPEGTKYAIQVSPEDCTGCGVCVEACPAKNKREARLKAVNMAAQAPILDQESKAFSFFDQLRSADLSQVNTGMVKGSQLKTPLFEYSGACAGCGETPYLKLISQLYGDRLAVANATGCSSIYGGNLPTTPWASRADGRGPVWSNSLFEDNAEFGLGYRLAYAKRREMAVELLDRMGAELGEGLLRGLIDADQSTDAGVEAQRGRVAELKKALQGSKDPLGSQLLSLADSLVHKSVWIVGGDGWAYDIGYGGLDHVLASGQNVNILVLDTEVYSNTGGQASKATPRAAVAKFAASGKKLPRKDLSVLAMTYGNVYVARVAFGANDMQTVKAITEAESYPGVSLIIAYSHCIAHGFDLRQGLAQQKAAVDCGYWPLLRYDPRRKEQGLNPLQLDSRAPKMPIEEYAYKETRYRMLQSSFPDEAKRLMKLAQGDLDQRWKDIKAMADAPGQERPAETVKGGS